MRRLVVAIVFCWLAVGAGLATAREWTDSTGLKRFAGDFVGWQDDLVVLQDAKGVKYGCKLERLSQSDQEYLRTLAPAKPAAAPALAQKPAVATQRVPQQSDVRTATKTVPTSARTSAPPVAASAVESLPVPAAEVAATDPPAPTVDETLTAQEGEDYHYRYFRYVYFGHHGTYHITWNIGTAHQFYHCDHTLVGLKYHSQDSWYYYYTVNEPGLTKQWYAFAKHPDGCKYAVWRKADWHHNGNYFWHRIDYADRVRPRLPRP